MSGQRGRFDRWRAKQAEHTRYLAEQVINRIVPQFEMNGFEWFDDFAAGDPKEVSHNEIPLQRRRGPQWATVQIRFDKRGRPFFMIDFAALPIICRRQFGTEEIPREQAIVAYAPAYFRLSKGERAGANGTFGYTWLSWAPRRRIDFESDAVISLLPSLFRLFDAGIPDTWLIQDQAWYVSDHVILMGSWHIDEKRRAKRDGGDVPK
jgi:hypothetical protein